MLTVVKATPVRVKIMSRVSRQAANSYLPVMPRDPARRHSVVGGKSVGSRNLGREMSGSGKSLAAVGGCGREEREGSLGRRWSLRREQREEPGSERIVECVWRRGEVEDGRRFGAGEVLL